MQCALWRFASGDTSFENRYLALNIDMLHQTDLRIFKTLIAILQIIVQRTQQFTSNSS